MHPKKRRLHYEISQCLSDLGAAPTASLIEKAMKIVIEETDFLFSDILRTMGRDNVQAVLSRFHGVRVMVQIGGVVPGILWLLLDARGLFPMEYDVGWGKEGIRLDEREQVIMLRAVYTKIAEEASSHHARLEMMQALASDNPQPEADVWAMLEGYPDQALIKDACIAAIKVHRWL